MNLKTVKIEDAVGMVLAHDVTEIRKGEFKGRAFKRGHLIQPADICRLQRLGKQHIYVWKTEPGYMHENDAAAAMAASFCGEGVLPDNEPREGKLNLIAERDGLLKVNVALLTDINLLGDVMCASRHTNTLVRQGEVVAGTRAIPLAVKTAVVQQAVDKAAAGGGIFHVKAVRSARAGIVITGSEVFNGLIEDRFEPVLRDKIEALGATLIATAIVSDEPAAIAAEIRAQLSAGADLIITTGGMSVDPDDVTRAGIVLAGGSATAFGAPILPGAMFMVAFIDDVPVLGVPACGLYHPTTILDLLLPRILTGEEPDRTAIARMGHGGLCLNCTECRFPVCPFGK
jgi:hypothetical protein